MDRVLKIYLLTFLLGLSGLAFTPYLPLFGPSGVTEVTPVTFGATTWYEPSRSYTTNGGIATLANLTSLGSIFDLTNHTTLGFPVRQVAIQNGLDGLFFNSAVTNWLECTNYQTMTPHEMIFAIAITNNAAVRTIFNSMNFPTTHDFLVGLAGPAKFQVQTDSHGGSSTSVFTNQYIVVNAFITATNCRVFTNLGAGVLVGGTVTATNCDGMLIGRRNAIQFASAPQAGLFSLLALITFTNQYISVATRSNCYWYLTNRFNLAP